MNRDYFRLSSNNHKPGGMSSGGDSKKRGNKIAKALLKGKKAIQKICMALGDSWDQHDAKIRAEALTPQELLTAPGCVQKAHKYNVLGNAYCVLSSKYKTGSLLGSGNYGKVSPCPSAILPCAECIIRLARPKNSEYLPAYRSGRAPLMLHPSLIYHENNARLLV